jgi:hypothetical protein
MWLCGYQVSGYDAQERDQLQENVPGHRPLNSSLVSVVVECQTNRLRIVNLMFCCYQELLQSFLS